jgi:hypothetical protein
MFLELIEQEMQLIEEQLADSVIDFILECYDEEEYPLIKEEFSLDGEEYEAVMEMVRQVSSTGAVTKTQKRAVRKIRAGMTTGMTAQERRQRAMKAARTRKKNPAIVKRALKKRQKAMNRRKVMGIKAGT